MGIARVAEEEDKLLIGKFQGGGGDKREEDMESRKCRDIFDLQRSRRGWRSPCFQANIFFVKVGMSKKKF